MNKAEMRSRIAELETQLHEEKVGGIRDAVLHQFLNRHAPQDCIMMGALLESHLFKNTDNQILVEGMVQALGDLSMAISGANAFVAVQDQLEEVLY